MLLKDPVSLKRVLSRVSEYKKVLLLYYVFWGLNFYLLIFSKFLVRKLQFLKYKNFFFRWTFLFFRAQAQKCARQPYVSQINHLLQGFFLLILFKCHCIFQCRPYSRQRSHNIKGFMLNFLYDTQVLNGYTASDFSKF